MQIAMYLHTNKEIQ